MVEEKQEKYSDYQLSDEAKAKIDKWVAKFPAEQKQSAVLAALHIVQDDIGWLPQGAMDCVADYLDMPRIAVYEVATFYIMYHLKPVGKHKIYLCTNISCLLRGSDQIEAHLKKKLGIDYHGTTPDGQFYLEEVECLGCCAGAPMMQVDKTYHENLTPEKVDEILAGLE